jgi:hypothetical protein
MFKNKNDCEALLKRFRILTRKSLDMTDKELNDVLDNIRQDREMFSYTLYNYLLSYDSKYFKENKAINNNVMELYTSVAVADDETEKIKTTSDLKTFTENFKKYFVDSKKRIRITRLKQYFSVNGLFEQSSVRTFKFNLSVTLDKCVSVSKDKNKDITIKSDEAYEVLYNQYFIVEEGDPKEESKDPNNTPTDPNKIEEDPGNEIVDENSTETTKDSTKTKEDPNKTSALFIKL